MDSSKESSVSFYLLLALIFFQGISGLYGGGALILDPTGAILQMPLDLLEGSPFDNYLIPGLILFFVLGGLPLIVFYRAWKRKAWAWIGTVIVSIALIIWIGVEIAMVGYHSEPPLQLIYGFVGVILLILTQLSPVRSMLTSRDRKNIKR